MDKTKIYSPRQVAMGAFFGGPIAAIYMLAKNYGALGEKNKQENTVLFGAFFTGLLIVILPYLPAKFPHLIIPIGYMAVARTIAQSHQLSKAAIQESRDYDFRPTLNVVVLSVISVIIFLALSFLWLFGTRVFDKFVLHH